MPWGGFWSPGSDLEPPRSTFWPGDLFGSIVGSRKTYFREEMILWWGYRGIPSAQMNSVVPGTHLGVLVCPKTSLFNYPTPVPGFPSTPRSFLEAGLAEAAFVEAGLVECGARSAPALVAPGAMGPRDHGTRGPWDHRGPMDLLGPWPVGPRDHGPFGPMDLGPFGPKGGPEGPAGPFGPT